MHCCCLDTPAEDSTHRQIYHRLAHIAEHMILKEADRHGQPLIFMYGDLILHP